jgi:hypothetical protein
MQGMDRFGGERRCDKKVDFHLSRLTMNFTISIAFAGLLPLRGRPDFH